MSEFEKEVNERLKVVHQDERLVEASREFMAASIASKYSYNFFWQGRPIIQYPQDIVALQEVIWAVRPDLVIETGIAHGGSLVLSASMLALLDMCDAIAAGDEMDPNVSNRLVVGIDIDIRPHNRTAIEAHPMFSRMRLIEGSSTDSAIIRQIEDIASDFKTVLVLLDSNHTHEHVLAELEAYAPLVSKGSYLVAFDTIIEDLPSDAFPDRNWGIGDNPKTAVHAFLADHPEFEIDGSLQDKLLLTVAPDGFLKRTS